MGLARDWVLSFADRSIEGVNQAFGDGAGLAIGDGTAVDFGDGDDFGAGAGEEAFVGDVDVLAGHVFFGCRDAGSAGELHNDLAGDAHEDAAVFGWGEELAIFDDEDVVAGAFGDHAEVIEHEGFGDAGVDGLPFGQDVVEVVEAFDFGAGGVGVVAHDAGGDDGHAVFVGIFGVHLDVVGDDEDGGGVAIFGRDAEVADTAGDHEADIAVAKFVGDQRLFEGVGELLGGVGNFEADALRGFEEALEVGFLLEDAAGILADAFKDAVAIKQAVVVDGDLGIGLGEKFAIEPDDGRGGVEGGGGEAASQWRQFQK